MKEEDLVKLMDNYMGSGGFYMKPSTEEDGKNSFLVGGGDAKLSDVEKSFEIVKEEIGEKKKRNAKIFSGNPGVDCTACASIPNISDIDK